MSSLQHFMSGSFFWIAYGTLALAPVVFLLLFYIKAPYGRHIRRGWGPLVENRLAWAIMESPSVLVFGSILLLYAELNLTSIILFLLWQLHYCHRAFVYPWTLKSSKKMPLLIMLMGLAFNVTNGFLNGWSIYSQGDKYTDAWLTTPYFLIGVLVFLLGMGLNKVSDLQLARLRVSSDGKQVYQIPFGIAYRWVSCPNYLGEIIQWTGWAIAVWSLAGWVFAIWTVANLVPRAIAHHQWYRDSFANYPPERRALIPYLL